jgi:hypothetical protein
MEPSPKYPPILPNTKNDNINKSIDPYKNEFNLFFFKKYNKPNGKNKKIGLPIKSVLTKSIRLEK